MRKCPTHNMLLEPTETRHGMRYDCPVPGCTVMCWDGETSTPADSETRQLRIEAHRAFDTLWQRQGMKRQDAYRWLQGAMSVPPEYAHIGMFDAEQCRRVIDAVGAFTEGE